MTDTTPDLIPKPSGTIESLKDDCFTCVITGNVYTPKGYGIHGKDATCAPPASSTTHINSIA